jgi:hypothetical protein
MENKITMALMLHNTIYQCRLDGKFYNEKYKKAYAVGEVTSVLPQGNMAIMNLQGSIICEDCWKANIDDGLKFTEPSKITIPNSNSLSRISSIKRG